MNYSTLLHNSFFGTNEQSENTNLSENNDMLGLNPHARHPGGSNSLLVRPTTKKIFRFKSDTKRIANENAGYLMGAGSPACSPILNLGSDPSYAAQAKPSRKISKVPFKVLDAP